MKKMLCCLSGVVFQLPYLVLSYPLYLNEGIYNLTTPKDLSLVQAV